MSPILEHVLSLPYLAALLYALLGVAYAASRLKVSLFFQLSVGLVLAFPSLIALLITLTPLRSDFALFSGALPPVLSTMVFNLLGPIGLSFVGAAVGRVIKHPNTLLAASGFAIFFDIVIVTMGTVAQLMRSGSNLIASVSVGAGAPVAAAAGTPARFLLPPPLSGVTIGPADVLFLAVFLSAVIYLKLAERATFRWMFILLMLALTLVETTALPVPALVPMGVAVLIANVRYAAFTRDEKYALIYGTGFALMCAAGIIFMSRSLFAPAPRFGFAVDRLQQNGIMIIRDVEKDSIAARAGLKPGDALLTLDGTASPELSMERVAELAKKAQSEGVIARVLSQGEAKPRNVTLKLVK
jgi:hypothetical protein